MTQDIDLVFKHMNNARYLRELDFARFHYYDRSGLFSGISAKGGGMVQGACSARYRRPLPIFTPYKITTQVRYFQFLIKIINVINEEKEHHKISESPVKIRDRIDFKSGRQSKFKSQNKPPMKYVVFQRK